MRLLLGIKTLVSAQHLQEVELILQEAPDILDLKNPLEGSLGAPLVTTIRDVGTILDSFKKENYNEIEFSVAIGDFPNLPGTASMAAFGVAQLHVDYVKIGLYGPKSKDEGIKLTRAVVDAVHMVNQETKVVVAGYADFRNFTDMINPLEIPEITSVGGADVAMLDTKIKNGVSLFSNLSLNVLEEFIELCKEKDLIIALAGSLQLSDLEKIKLLKPDIIGVRSMVCENFDRLHGSIQPELIRKLKAKLL